MTMRYEICSPEEIPPGDQTIVEIEGLSIGIFNIDGEFYALNNLCPHQLAPLCEGEHTGITTANEVGEYEWSRDGEIIKCPWHNWAFDIITGESVFNPHEVRTRTYDVAVESGNPDKETADNETERYGTELSGEKPPIETYDVEVEQDVIVLYI